MSTVKAEDWYEMLQISPNADADTVQRVFRLLAQKFHPDNQETGDAERFRRLHEAYLVLSDPEKRAQYDVGHEAIRRERWRFASTPSPAENDFESERRRFESGLSTVFLVLERQTALVTAQARELRTRADLNQAIARLELATGGTLERHGVVLAN